MKRLNKGPLLALCSAYTSYLFREPEAVENITRIFLFGSVARGDFDRQSDIDLFIDVPQKEAARVQKLAKSALKKFSAAEMKRWELRGIENKLSIKVGTLEEWELREAVEREGLLLYASSAVPSLKKYLLFTFVPITEPRKRMQLNRLIFGRREKHFRGTGLVGKYAGRIFSPRVFLLSSDGLKEITSLFSKAKVSFKFEEVWK